VTDLVWFVFSPGGMVVFTLAGVLWLYARPASRGPRWFLLLTTVAYALCSVYAIDYGVGRLLVRGFHPFSRSDVGRGRMVIVVLGSGSFTARDWDSNAFSTVDSAAATRVVEAERVFRLTDADWVISSGGTPHADDPNARSGDTMRDALMRLGVPSTRLLVETESRNTRDEAQIVGRLLPSLHVEQVILVTSDLHMRRSVGAFRAAGIRTVPAIARDPFSAYPLRDWLLPSDYGLWYASAVAHELGGLIYYMARGWYKP
jgi:uncharacterized SAM-binding protein YcdF (DUF218 family)